MSMFYKPRLTQVPPDLRKMILNTTTPDVNRLVDIILYDVLPRYKIFRVIFRASQLAEKTSECENCTC